MLHISLSLRRLRTDDDMAQRTACNRLYEGPSSRALFDSQIERVVAVPGGARGGEIWIKPASSLHPWGHLLRGKAAIG